MKVSKAIIKVTGIVLALLSILCAKGTSSNTKPRTEKEIFSYTIGREVAASMKDFWSEIDVQFLSQGISDAFANKESAISEQEAAGVREAVFKRLQEDMMQKRIAQGEKSKKEAEEFIAKNKSADGVVTTSSGLQYKVLRSSKGAKPKITDVVKVHYKGTLLDGTEFDNSYARGEPATFGLNQVIPGWSEGVQLMNVGGKYQLWIPPDLAYGERGAGGKIPPNSLLVFEIELLEIVKEK